MIDAHLHLWQLSTSPYRWMTGPVLRRDHLPDEAWSDLQCREMTGAIAVQADRTFADTEFLLRHAVDRPWIRGVVGWLPVNQPEVALARLDAWRGRPLVGIRFGAAQLAAPPSPMIINRFIDDGLPIDVLGGWQDLAPVTSLARAHPDLTLIIDHLAEPPLTEPASMAAWCRELAAAARLPNVAAKVSGLYPAASLPPDQAENLVTDCVSAMIDCFGPDRLLYGGDWPISTLHAEAGSDLALKAIRRLPADVRESLMVKTATRLYLAR